MAKTIVFYSKTHGSYETLVDDDDYKILQDIGGKWCISKKRNSLVYFQKRLPGNNLIELHRFIMKNPKGKYVDHINGNTLDNRKANLRVCSNAANLRNQTHIRPNNTSGYTGVYFDVNRKKWAAEIKVNYVKKSLGRFTNIEDAIKARKSAEAKYFDT